MESASATKPLKVATAIFWQSEGAWAAESTGRAAPYSSSTF